MSWVCDILLLCDLQELNSDGDETRIQPLPIVNLNAWLEAHEWAPLVQLQDYIGMKSEKAFQACAYGAALNFLDIPAFLKAVADQSWQIPGALLLLLKNEDWERFKVYRMTEGRLESQET